MSTPKRSLRRRLRFFQSCIPICFLFSSALSWSQPYPKDFPIHPGSLKPLLGSWESGEPQSYSINLDDGNSGAEPIEEFEGILRTPMTAEGLVGYKYLGKTKGGVHVLQVWENCGGTLTMQSVLLVRVEKHTALEDRKDRVVPKEKRILTSLGQIMLFGDGVSANLKNDVLTYLSQGKSRTLDLQILQPLPNESQEEESGAELLTTADMIEHENKELEKVDRELNQVYKELMKELDPEGQEKLRQSQRAWIAFRDANADFAADAARGGSLAGILHISTQVQMTQERVKELKDSQMGE